jgi:hypothetical protein
MERILASSPLLSPNEAHAVALSLTTAYVGGLYISRLSLLRQNAAKASYAGSKNGETPFPDLIETESANELDRDDPKVIKSRIRAVSLATLGGCAAVGAIIYYRGDVKDLKASVSNEFPNTYEVFALINVVLVLTDKDDSPLPRPTQLFTAPSKLPPTIRRNAEIHHSLSNYHQELLHFPSHLSPTQISPPASPLLISSCPLPRTSLRPELGSFPTWAEVRPISFLYPGRRSDGCLGALRTGRTEEVGQGR